MASAQDLTKIAMAAAEQALLAYEAKIGKAWEQEAQAMNPAKSQGKIHYESDGLHVPLIPYLLSKGSKAHTIRAVNAKSLRFFWAKKGKWVQFLSVRHPGYKGTGYLDRAWANVRQRIQSGEF